MLPLLKRVLFVVGIVIILAVFFFNNLPLSSATTYGYPDSVVGWGTNDNDSLFVNSMDFKSKRFPWIQIDPNDSQPPNLNPIITYVSNTLNQPSLNPNRIAVVGINWKNLSNNSATPQFVVNNSIYNPINYSPTENMVNYIDPEVKNRMALVIDKLATQFAGNPRVAFLITSGIDAEAQPERDLREIPYVNAWGGSSNAQIEWVNHIKWLIDTWQQKAPNNLKYLVISAHFRSAAERDDYIPYLIQNYASSGKWGFYVASIDSGYRGTTSYGLAHSTTSDEILPGYQQIQDAMRKLCVIYPCIGEHGDFAGGVPLSTEWQAWWHAASALWQRVDGYATLRTAGGFSQENPPPPAPTIDPTIPALWHLNVRSFFDRYAGKSYFNTPDAWVALHQDYRSTGNPLNQRNFSFYLDQFDSSNVDGKNATSYPEWAFCFVSGFQSPCSQTSDPRHEIALYNPTNDYRGFYTRRTRNPGQILAFRQIADANGDYFIQRDKSYDLKLNITYLDFGSDSFSIYYSSTTGLQNAGTVNKTNTPQWITTTINLPNAQFNQSIDGADFYIDDNSDGDEYIHWVSVSYANGINPNPTPTVRPTGPANTPPPGVTLSPTISPTPSGTGSGLGTLMTSISSPIGLLMVIALLIVLDFFVKPEKII